MADFWIPSDSDPEVIFPVLQPGQKSPSQQLTFIVSTKNSHVHTKDVRKKVRSHVMSNYRRSHVLERAKITPPGDAIPAQPLSKESTKLHTDLSQNISPYMFHSTCQRCGGLKASSSTPTHVPLQSKRSLPHLVNSLSAASIDPFRALPVNTIPPSYLVLDHCTLLF